MRTTALISLLTLALFATACSSAPPKQSPMGSGELPPVEDVLPPKAMPSKESIEQRVSDAQARLMASEAGKQLWAAIEAQGGLKTWYERGPIGFRFNYKPKGDRPPNDTYQLVDTWSSKAVHQLHSDPTVRFGWDGKQAWQQVPEGKELKINARFWALTPYYFVAIPFVLADPGVKLATMPPIELEGKPYNRIKATFEAGTGDAPDDYYIVYLEPSSSRLRAVSYIVSYKGFFPEGGHSPEKLMYYDGDQTVEGITLPTHYRTFSLKEGLPAEHVTDVTLTDVSFKPETLATEFNKPEDATLVEKM